MLLNIRYFIEYTYHQAYGGIDLFMFRYAGGSLHLFTAAQHDVGAVCFLLLMLEHRQCAQRCISGAHLLHELQITLKQRKYIRT